MKGLFITFEGSEGSGKSTQIDMVYQYLKAKDLRVILLREPGAVEISEKIRDILLDEKNKKMGKECETLLYMAARAQLVEELLAPELKKGALVLCDRFLDSTLAYQGYGAGVSLDSIRQMGSFATQGLTPDLTFIFDLEASEGLARLKRKKDRIEQRAIAYHDRVRQGYLKIAAQEPERIVVIPVAGKEREEIQSEVRQRIDEKLNNV